MTSSQNALNIIDSLLLHFGESHHSQSPQKKPRLRKRRRKKTKQAKTNLTQSNNNDNDDNWSSNDDYDNTLLCIRGLDIENMDDSSTCTRQQLISQKNIDPTQHKIISRNENNGRLLIRVAFKQYVSLGSATIYASQIAANNTISPVKDIYFCTNDLALNSLIDVNVNPMHTITCIPSLLKTGEIIDFQQRMLPTTYKCCSFQKIKYLSILCLTNQSKTPRMYFNNITFQGSLFDSDDESFDRYYERVNPNKIHIKYRTHLNLCVFSIDTAGTQNIDDAFSIEHCHAKNGNERYKVGIHITDATYSHNTIDEEMRQLVEPTIKGRENTTNTISDQELAEHYSFRPTIPKYSMSLFIDFDSKGDVCATRSKEPVFIPTIIKSRCALSFQEANNILDGLDMKQKEVSDEVKESYMILYAICGEQSWSGNQRSELLVEKLMKLYNEKANTLRGMRENQQCNDRYTSPIVKGNDRIAQRKLKEHIIHDQIIRPIPNNENDGTHDGTYLDLSD